MKKIIIRNEMIHNDLNFIIYNIAFSQSSGTFTKKLIFKELIRKDLVYTESMVNELIENWIDDGMIFDDMSQYIVNRMLE